MNMPLFRLSHGAALLTLAILLGSCAGSAPLQSSYRTSDIEIDGSERDWFEFLRPIEKQNMSMGVVNDDEFLYVAALTSDPNLVARFATLGLVLWIDPAGGDRQAVGIQFPLGETNLSRTTQPPRTQEEREALFERSLYEMELLRDAGEERIRLPTNSMVGIITSATLRNGTLFYEAQIPLQTGGPYTFAAGARPGTPLGVGIESAEIPPERRRQRMLEGAANSPMQGGGSYGGYYGGASPPPAVIRGDEGLRIWHEVQLATD